MFKRERDENGLCVSHSHHNQSTLQRVVFEREMKPGMATHMHSSTWEAEAEDQEFMASLS